MQPQPRCRQIWSLALPEASQSPEHFPPRPTFYFLCTSQPRFLLFSPLKKKGVTARKKLWDK